MRRLFFFSLFLFHGCLASGISYLGLRESSVFNYGPERDPSFRERVLGGSVSTGISNYSSNRLLINCVSGLRSFRQRLAPIDNRDAFAGKCRTFAEQVRENAPLNSLSWVVTAISSQQIGDINAMNTGLVNSQRTAPNEQWLAIGRYHLSVEHAEALTPEAKSAYQADLALLAQSRFGVRAIAGRYVSNPEFREQITDIVSKLPSDTQNRFLNSIRAVMNNQN